MAQLDEVIQHTQDIRSLPAPQKQQVAVEALTGLTDQAKQEAAEAAGMPSPSTAAADRLWLVEIVVIAAVFALAALSPALGLGDNKTMLTVFTTIGALVGLFVPSPVQKKLEPNPSGGFGTISGLNAPTPVGVGPSSGAWTKTPFRFADGRPF